MIWMTWLDQLIFTENHPLMSFSFVCKLSMPLSPLRVCDQFSLQVCMTFCNEISLSSQPTSKSFSFRLSSRKISTCEWHPTIVLVCFPINQAHHLSVFPYFWHQLISKYLKLQEILFVHHICITDNDWKYYLPNPILSSCQFNKFSGESIYTKREYCPDPSECSNSQISSPKEKYFVLSLALLWTENSWVYFRWQFLWECFTVFEISIFNLQDLTRPTTGRNYSIFYFFYQ